MPLYSFSEKYDFSGKTIVPFNTHGGSGFSKTIETIKEMEPLAPLIKNGLSISRNDVNESKGDIIKWLDSLNIAK